MGYLVKSQKQPRDSKLARVGPENSQVSHLLVSTSFHYTATVPCLQCKETNAPFFSLWASAPHSCVGVPPQKASCHLDEASQVSAHLPFSLDETRTLGLCGMVWEHKDGTDYHKQPWHAKISVTVSTASWWWGLVGGEVRWNGGKGRAQCGVCGS